MATLADQIGLTAALTQAENFIDQQTWLDSSGQPVSSVELSSIKKPKSMIQQSVDFVKTYPLLVIAGVVVGVLAYKATRK